MFAELILIVPVDLKDPEWASGLSRSGRTPFSVCLSKHYCASSPVSSVYSLYRFSYSEKCPCHLCSLEMGDTVLCCCHRAFQTLIFVCLSVNGPRKEMGHKQNLTIHTAGKKIKISRAVFWLYLVFSIRKLYKAKWHLVCWKSYKVVSRL